MLSGFGLFHPEKEPTFVCLHYFLTDIFFYGKLFRYIEVKKMTISDPEKVVCRITILTNYFKVDGSKLNS